MPMRNSPRTAVSLAGLACLAWIAVAGCDPAAPPDGGGGAGGETGGAGAGGAPGCGDCHGTAENPAPDGSAAGAHAAHLAPPDDHGAIRCSACHEVPETVDAPGHRDDDRPADVRFSGLAARRVTPSYGPDGCTVYCHGGGLLVEQRRSPPWDAAGPLGCTSCHGMPPPPPHPAADDCATCHLDVIDEGGAIAGPSRHIDSMLSAPAAGHHLHLGGDGRQRLPCTACHTDEDYLLRDHRPLESTTVCDPCHAPGTVDAEEWRSLPGLAGDLPVP